MIQIASVFGTYGVSFLIVLINSALTIILLHLLQKTQISTRMLSMPAVSRRGTFIIATLTVVLVGIAYIYGAQILAASPQGEKIKVTVIQGNIAQSLKWDKQFAPEIMQIYSDLTKEASREKPDLIVWPETATPWAMNLDPRLKKQIETIAKNADAYLLLGSAQTQKFKLDDPKSAKFKNSAYLVSADGKLEKNRYDKINLLPFGEYLPYRDKIPWHYIKVPAIGSYIPGNEFLVFEAPFGRFSATICWENVFSDTFRKFVENGAQFMINITNEAWFGNTSAPYHFLSMSVLRAVENQVAVIRCANTGVSGFIDPCGRIVDRVRGQDGSDIFVRGILTKPVILSKSKTLYTRYGEFFPKFCAIVTLAFVLFSVLTKRLNSMPEE